MNILLRKLWILSSLTLAANAEIVFDLNAQHLQNAIGLDANGQNVDVIETPSRYNLPKTYVSTGLIYQNGNYTLKNNSWQDQFYVEVKNPISTWNVNFGVTYNFDYAAHTIKFISDTGKTITIGMYEYRIFFNSYEVYIDSGYYNWTDITGSVSMNGGNVDFVINGTTKAITVPNFSKLKYVSVSILNDYIGANTKSVLKSLTIGSSD